MNASLLKKAVNWAGYAICILGLWQALVYIWAIPDWLLPAPASVLRSLVDLPEYYFRNFYVTALEACLGLSLAAVFGFFVSILLYSFPRIANLTLPVLIGLQAFPIVAIAPIIMIIFGYGIPSKVFVVFFICWLPCFFYTYNTLKAIPQAVLNYTGSLGMSPLQSLIFEQLPHSVPGIVGGLRISTPFAVVGAVVGEFAGSKGSGLGYVILTSMGDLSTERAYASLLLLALLSAGMYRISFMIEKKSLRLLYKD